MARYYVAKYTYQLADGNQGKATQGSEIDGRFNEQMVFDYFLQNAKELGHEVNSFKLLNVRFFDTNEEMMDYSNNVKWD